MWAQMAIKEVLAVKQCLQVCSSGLVLKHLGATVDCLHATSGIFIEPVLARARCF